MRWTQTCGRLSLTLRAFRQGRDLQVLCSGGDAHIGAVALATPHKDATQTSVLLVPGHREEGIAQHMANRLACALNCTVCVSVGIHYDHIQKEEIITIENMARQLTESCLTAIMGDTVC